MLNIQSYSKVKEIFEQNLSGHLDEEESSKSIQDLRQYRDGLPAMINLIVLDFYYQQIQSYEDTQLEVFFTNLRDFLDELIDKKIIREKDLFLSLDVKILDQTELIDEKSLKKKMMQIYTLKNFKQEKYNLLCESISGYSTFISRALLMEEEKDSNFIYESLKQIIGFYNLDPNKLIEIVIDILKCYSSQIDIDFDLDQFGLLKALIDILRQSNRQNIQILVLQRLLCLEQKDKAYSLLNVLAVFCKYDLLDCTLVYDNLYPRADEIVDNLKDKNSSSLSLFKEAFTIRLFKTEDEEQYNKQRIDNLEKQYYEPLNKNQKIEFLYSLLNVNNYQDFSLLYETINLKFFMRKNELFIEPLLKLFNKLIYVFTKKQQNIQNRPKEFQLVSIFKEGHGLIQENLQNFLQKVQELLQIISTNISYDQEAFENLLILLKELKQLDQQKFIDNVVVQILIPTLFVKTLKSQQKQFCLQKAQEFMQNFKYIERFRFYQKVQQDYLYENMFIVNPFVVNETKNFLNTICAGQHKEQENQEKMKLLLEENPFFVGQLLLAEIQKYKSLTQILVPSFQHTNLLVKEIVLWLTLNELQKCEIQVRDSISDEYQLLYIFLAKFLQQNCELELESVLTYLLNKISITEGQDYLNFLVLKQILEEILGYKIVHEANSTQIAGSLGGVNLQVCLFQYSQTFIESINARKKFGEVLFGSKTQLNEEIEFSYFWIFYFHLCKNNIRGLYSTSTFSIKTNNSLIDQIQETKQLLLDLLQFVDKDNIGLSYDHLNFILQNSMKLLPTDILQIASVIFRIFKNDLTNENFDEFFDLIEANKNNIFNYDNFIIESMFIDNKSIQEFKLDKNMVLVWYLKSQDIYCPIESYLQAIEKYQNIISNKDDENLDIPYGYQSKDQYIKTCEQIRQDLEKELSRLQKHQLTNQKFIEEQCYKKTENNHQFIYQGLLLKLCRSTKEAYLCSQLYQMTYIKNSESYSDIISKNFRIIYKLIPCLNGFTQDEALHFAQFFSFLFNLVQYVEENDFKQQFKIELKKFSVDKDIQIKEKDIQETLQNKFKKLIDIIQVDFDKSSPVYAKNVLIFLKTIMHIFPKSIDNIDLLLTMFNKNEHFINLYPDLKLSCQNYRKYLEVKKQKQLDILYPPQTQKEQGSPQYSKASFAKKSQKSYQKKQNSPESSKNYSKKYNNNNRNKDYQRQQGNRNQDNRYNRDNRQRRNNRDRDRDRNQYYRKKNQFN